MPAGDIRDHHVRCAPHLAWLQMLAGHDAGEPLLAGLSEEVGRATGAVLAEARAAGRAAVAAVTDSHHQGAAASFLEARLARLAAAAAEAVAAARDGDPAAFRRHVRRFETLTSALWTVQLAVSAQASRPRPARPHRRPRRSSSS